METTTTTRRSLLKAAPIAATLAVVPTSAIGAATDRSQWEKALAAYNEVKAEDAAFSARYRIAWKQCDAELERLPHITSGHYSTAHWDQVEYCRREVKALDEGRVRYDPLPDLIEKEQNMRALVAGDDQRKAAIQAIRDRYDMDALDDRSDELGDRICERERELMHTPAPDLAALRWKLDFITQEAKEDDGCLPAYTSDFVRQMLADIAALMPVGA